MFKYFLFIAFCWFSLAQTPTNTKIIKILHSDFIDQNQFEIPGAIVFTGNVLVEHDGVKISCNKAYHFKDENYVKAFGNVQLNQGDTIFMNSRYAEYNGNRKFAYATGGVVLTSPESTLSTDTINFDRNIQEAYYNSNGTIINKENTLKSTEGRYFVNLKKYQFRKNVTIINPKYTIKTNHLDYYDAKGHAYLFGPSTITSKENYIYTEKGFYDTRKNHSYLLKNSYIKYNNRLIKGDSIYYDRNKEFASASRNIKITDTVNKMIIKGHYGEVYRDLKNKKDSLFITKRAVIITQVEKDSLYMHGKRMVVNGPEGDRIIRAYNNVRFYKTDMSGTCDSVHSNNKTALTKLIGKPVLWHNDNQMTGEIMHLIGNNKTEKLDSLKILKDAFIIQKDTLGKGYNQMKGQVLYGKFIENKLKQVDIVKNVEAIYYMYNEKNQLVGINKSICSALKLELNDNKIETITFFKNTDGNIYPEVEFPENARKLRGFVWRGDERIKSKDDIFPEEENNFDKEVKNLQPDDKPMKVLPETTN